MHISQVVARIQVLRVWTGQTETCVDETKQIQVWKSETASSDWYMDERS